MIWQHIRGHDTQIEMFRRSIGRGRLSHAYLFVGPDGIGKKLFARALAQCLLCQRSLDADLEACGGCPGCKQVAAGTHPDLYVVGKPEGKSVLPIEVFAGDQEHRGREGLCYEIARRPMEGDRKIAIVDDVDFMNQESANAFLKTLEEPPASALIILLATNLDGILPTIRSRCQLVRFSPLGDDDVSQLLLETGLLSDPAEADAVAAMSEGSLTVAAQLIDPALRAIRQTLYDELSKPDFDSIALAAAMIGATEEIKSEAASQRQAAAWIVRFATEFYRQVLLALSAGGTSSTDPHVQRFVKRLDSASPDDLEHLGELIERTMAAEDQLSRNAAPALCFEALFDDLGRLTRVATTS